VAARFRFITARFGFHATGGGFIAAGRIVCAAGFSGGAALGERFRPAAGPVAFATGQILLAAIFGLARGKSCRHEGQANGGKRDSKQFGQHDQSPV
jgi:hypothetical protein